MALLAGAANWAFRVLPTLARTDRLQPGGWLERFLAATGPAAIATLFVASILPLLSPGLAALSPVVTGTLAVLAVYLGAAFGGGGHAGRGHGLRPCFLADQLTQDLRRDRASATIGTMSQGAVMLEISPQKVVQVIFLAREGHVGAAELHAFIDDLNDDEKAQLTAVAWVGRGAFEPEDFDEAVATATSEATTPTADYLMGMPHLAENLEAGLGRAGCRCVGRGRGFPLTAFRRRSCGAAFPDAHLPI